MDELKYQMRDISKTTRHLAAGLRKVTTICSVDQRPAPARSSPQVGVKNE